MFRALYIGINPCIYHPPLTSLHKMNKTEVSPRIWPEQFETRGSFERLVLCTPHCSMLSLESISYPFHLFKKLTSGSPTDCKTDNQNPTIPANSGAVMFYVLIC